MATLVTPFQSEKNKEKKQQEAGAQPIQVAQGQVAGFQGQQAPAATPQQTAQKGSGAFSNVNKYLEANKNVDYASKIGENVKAKEQELKQGLQKTGQAAQSTAQQTLSKENEMQSLAQKAKQNATSLSDEEIQKLYDFRQTAGPQLVDISQQQKGLLQQQQNLQQKAELAGTEGGRFQLLRDTLGGGVDYSKGKNSLDNLLLNTGGRQLSQLSKTTQEAVKQAGSGLTGLEQTVGSLNEQIKSQGLQSRDVAKNQLDQLAQQLQGSLQQQELSQKQSDEKLRTDLSERADYVSRVLSDPSNFQSEIKNLVAQGVIPKSWVTFKPVSTSKPSLGGDFATNQSQKLDDSLKNNAYRAFSDTNDPTNPIKVASIVNLENSNDPMIRRFVYDSLKTPQSARQLNSIFDTSFDGKAILNKEKLNQAATNYANSINQNTGLNVDLQAEINPAAAATISTDWKNAIQQAGGSRQFLQEDVSKLGVLSRIAGNQFDPSSFQNRQSQSSQFQELYNRLLNPNLIYSPAGLNTRG